MKRSAKKEKAHIKKCLNCDENLIGKYCYACGQARDTDRYSVKTFGKEFYKSFSKLDGQKTLNTFWELTKSPSEFCRNYLKGRRVEFINPIKYFLYAFVIDIAVNVIGKSLTTDATFLNEQYNTTHFQILDLLSTIFWGVLWWLFFRRSSLNLIENVICALYFVAQTNFYSTLATFILLPLFKYSSYGHHVAVIIDTIMVPAYSFYFSWKLFREPKWLYFPKQLILTFLFLVIVTSAIFFDQILTNLIITR